MRICAFDVGGRHADTRLALHLAVAAPATFAFTITFHNKKRECGDKGHVYACTIANISRFAYFRTHAASLLTHSVGSGYSVV